MKKTKTATWPSNITRQNVGCYHAASGGLNFQDGLGFLVAALKATRKRLLFVTAVRMVKACRQ